MKRLNVLHITDLHFSSKDAGSPTADVKDKSLSPAFTGGVGCADCRLRFLRDAPAQLEGRKPHVILARARIRLPKPQPPDTNGVT